MEGPVLNTKMSSATSADKSDRSINEEYVSIDSLKHVLCAHCGCKVVKIDKEEKDPPDFTVTVDGISYPAEVTSIVLDVEHHAHCKQFAKAIHDRANADGELSGKYALIVRRFPKIPKPASQDARKLRNRAVAYIHDTRQEVTCAKIQICKHQSGDIEFKKVSGEGSAVVVVWTPPAMWEGEIQGKLITLMQRAVTCKTKKLEDVGIDPQSALLLFYDAYGYGDASDAAIALQQVDGYDWFHSIFWAASFTDRKNAEYPNEPGREGLFLFSHAATWNGAGTVPLEPGG